MIDINNISTGLHLKDDNIWYSNNTSEISYPQDGNIRCFNIEDNSFWFKHRNNCIIAAIRSFPPTGPIFDVGGGNGYVTNAIIKSGYEAVLVEPGLEGAMNAKRKRGITDIICATIEDARVFPHSLPAIGIFDVLEHIEDELSFLTIIRELLSTEGKLYITVPAYPFLWSFEDVHAKHYRRYTLKSISAVLGLCGFEVEFETYIFRLLPIPIFLFRTIPSRLGLKKDSTLSRIKKEHAANNVLFKKLLSIFLASEVYRIGEKLSIPFGGSCLVVAKPQL